MKSAFLRYGRPRRPIFIEVPAEDPRSQLDGVLAKLVGSLYGTRDAPLVWQEWLRRQMKLLGFKESHRDPCMFYQETEGVEMIAHVNDLFVFGCLKDAQDVYHGLSGDSEMNCTFAGPKTGNSEVEYLARRMVFTENGLEIHGDPKHAAILLTETGMEMCNSVSSLHVADTKLLDTFKDDTWSYMASTDARRHRSSVTRVVCVAHDRPDLDVAARTLAKIMLHLKIGDEWLVKRVCRYIKERPRYAEFQCEAQDRVLHIRLVGLDAF